MGKAGNCIGGFTFQFSDGWWKFAQNRNLDIHDNNASWVNGGYSFDYVKGKNNMNEEWFGICAKGTTNAKGFYQLFPRIAYYTLKEIHQFNPYTEGTTLTTINNYFKSVKPMDASLKTGNSKATYSSDSKKLQPKNY